MLSPVWTPRGWPTAVAVGGPISSNPFGHAAVATTGEGVSSYGTADPVGEDFTQYLNHQSDYRGHCRGGHQNEHHSREKGNPRLLEGIHWL